MRYIDPHIHMVSRTTDDYARMALAGCVAVTEPAFWAGFDRNTPEGFHNYFRQLTEQGPRRAAAFGIRHYCTVGLNPKEANNEELAEGVMEWLPRFALKEGVVAIGEIGYDEQTALEDKYFRLQLELAKELALPVMIHTPHRDKKRGTTRSMDVCEEMGVDPAMVVIDHNNEETVAETLQRGFWAGFSIYPSTKMGNARMVELLKQYGGERIIVDSACDWGISDCLGVPKTAKLALDSGVPEAVVRKACYANALAVYGKSGQISEADWLNPSAIDQRTLYEGNTILRGGREPRIETPGERRAGSLLIE